MFSEREQQISKNEVISKKFENGGRDKNEKKGKLKVNGRKTPTNNIQHKNREKIYQIINEEEVERVWKIKCFLFMTC